MRFRLRSTHIDDLPLVADTRAPSDAAVSEETRAAHLGGLSRAAAPPAGGLRAALHRGAADRRRRGGARPEPGQREASSLSGRAPSPARARGRAVSACLSDDACARARRPRSIAERAHLAGCAACTGRSRQLRRDLDVITAVLRDTREPLILPGQDRARAPALAACRGRALHRRGRAAGVGGGRGVARGDPGAAHDAAAGGRRDPVGRLRVALSVSGDPVPAGGRRGPAEPRGHGPRGRQDALTGDEP